MNSRFDRRVVSESILDFVRKAQALVPCHLGGGAALSGAYLSHRLTGDIDLFVHGGRERHRDLVQALPEAASQSGCAIRVLRDTGQLVRAHIESAEGATELDLVHEPVPDLVGVQPEIEGVVVEALEDLRANKLTCILSRSEPRDLVDLYFLDQAGFAAIDDIDIALQKDAGIDPAVLAWLLSSFPLRPLPPLLKTLNLEDLKRFRDALANRFKKV